MKQAIRNSDIMDEFDRHARGRFMTGVLVGIGLAGAVMFSALAFAVWYYV